MSWTRSATDSSSLDGEWPFLQPIRCHRAPLLWSQPFTRGWITLIKAIFALLGSSAEVSWWHLRAGNLKARQVSNKTGSRWCALLTPYSPLLGMHLSSEHSLCQPSLCLFRLSVREQELLVFCLCRKGLVLQRLVVFIFLLTDPLPRWQIYEYKYIHEQCQHKCLLSQFKHQF